MLVGAWSDCTWSMIGLTITISGSYMQVTFWLSVSLLSLNAVHVFCTVEQVAMEGQGMYVKMSLATHECMESIDPRLAACMHGHSNRVTILLSYALSTHN